MLCLLTCRKGLSGHGRVHLTGIPRCADIARYGSCICGFAPKDTALTLTVEDAVNSGSRSLG